MGNTKPRRRIAGYREAIEWLAVNDDTDWLTAEYGTFSVTLALVADIYGRTTDEATADLRRLIERMDREAAKDK